MKKVIFLLFAMLMLTSCGNEPNDIAYVVAVGFDKGEDNNYEITLQFAKPTQISGGASEEGGKSGTDIVENITIEAPDIYSAINVANNIISKSFSLSHTKIAVFSKEVAKDGLKPIVSMMIRSEELRPDVFVAVAEDGAQEYLSSVQPVIEVNPAKYYQLIYHDSYSYGTPKTNLQQFYFDEILKNKNAVMPLAGTINSKDEQNNDEKSENSSEQNEEEKKNEENKDAKTNNGRFEYKLKNYSAGQALVKGNIKSESMGMVVFNEDKAEFELGSIESELYNILTGNFKNFSISFDSDIEKEPIAVKVSKSKNPSYKIDKDKKEINIKLYLDSDLYSLPENFNYSEDIKKLEDNIKESIEISCEEFIKNIRDEYNAEIIGFGIDLKRYFLTNNSYKNYNFKEDYKNYNINVDADFKIRRTGMKY